MIIVRFLVTFILIYLVNYLWTIRRKKEFNINDCPRDILYFIQVYKIKIDKVNYRNLLKRLGVVNSFILAFAYIIVILLDRLLLILLFTPLIIVSLIIICYKLLSIYYKKKGFVNNV